MPRDFERDDRQASYLVKDSACYVGLTGWRMACLELQRPPLALLLFEVRRCPFVTCVGDVEGCGFLADG
jgi:hypothetical protein